MSTKERAAPAGTSAAQGEPSTTKSIPSKAELRKMPPLKRLRIEKGLAAQDMTDTVCELYGKFDRFLLSKAENPDDYGVELREDALIALYARFAPEMAPKRARKERRTLPCRISARLSEADFKALQRLMRHDGYRTTQDWLLVMVKRAVNLWRVCEEAEHAQT